MKQKYGQVYALKFYQKLTGNYLKSQVYSFPYIVYFKNKYKHSEGFLFFHSFPCCFKLIFPYFLLQKSAKKDYSHNMITCYKIRFQLNMVDKYFSKIRTYLNFKFFSHAAMTKLHRIIKSFIFSIEICI